MKILFVLIRWKGGVGRYVSELSKKMKKLGWDIEFISRDELGCGLLGSFKKLRQEVKKRDYDVLMAEDWSIALPLIGLRNLFCTFNGLSINSPANVLQKVVYLLMKNRIIVVSDYLGGIFPKTKVIEEAVDFNKFKPNKKKKNKSKKFIVGFAQDTKDPLYKFKLIKETVSEMPDVELKATDYKLKPSEMPDFYNSLDAFISIPSRSNGFNLVWLESMACNIQTIGNTYGVGEKLPIIKMTEPPTKQKIKDAINKAKENQNVDYRNWLIENGFSWKKCAKEVSVFLVGKETGFVACPSCKSEMKPNEYDVWRCENEECNCSMKGG